MTELTFGCDPEFFVKKEGKHVSAHGLVPGTKASPYSLPIGAVQVDGMALEFNTPPASTWGTFSILIEEVLKDIRGMVGEEYEFDFSPVAHFGKEYIDEQPFEARELGCDPDYNAYTGMANPRPDGDMGFRTASGHIHIGWTKDMDPFDPDHFEACRMLTKQLDMSLGIASLWWDKDTTRASMYGKLGTFRPKPYGLEYRVLSNAWVESEILREIVFKYAKKSTEDLLKGSRYYSERGQYIDFSIAIRLLSESGLSVEAVSYIAKVYGEMSTDSDHLIPDGSPFITQQHVNMLNEYNTMAKSSGSNLIEDLILDELERA